MSRAEDAAREQLEADGFEVLRGGWPDFLAYKPDGTIRLIEVKGDSDRLHWHQHQLHCRLRDLGVPVEIVYVDKQGETY